MSLHFIEIEIRLNDQCVHTFSKCVVNERPELALGRVDREREVVHDGDVDELPSRADHAQDGVHVHLSAGRAERGRGRGEVSAEGGVAIGGTRVQVVHHRQGRVGVDAR